MWKSISNFFNQIAKDQLSAEFAKKAAKNEKDKAELQKQYDTKTKEIETLLVKKYGSVDKIPAIMKKKFNIVDNDSPEDKARKSSQEKERQKKQREKTALYQAKKEKERQKKRRQEKATKKTEFIEKYGKELGTKIAKGELWIGMSKEALMAIKGRPGKKIETISRNKKREEYFFDGYKNRQGNMSFKLKVILIDGLVEKWAKG
mgnify:CR=1 FL=1